MDLVEDLLFDGSDSQTSVHDMWRDEFDDEQGFGYIDSEYETDSDLFHSYNEFSADSWQLLSSPLFPTAACAITPPDEMLLEDLSVCAKSDVVSALDESRKPLRDRHLVIAKLESMLENIIDGLLEGRERLTFTLKSRTNMSRRRSITKAAARAIPTPRVRQISFPGSTAQEAWNFMLLRIIELVHGALVDNTIMTKRDIYYRHPDLFVKQAVVDRYVDDLACTLGISRSQLNVAAAAKGLVAGRLIIRRKDGTHIDATDDKEGMLVPKIEEADEVDLTQVRWILVVEKEATFRSLMCAPRFAELIQNGLAVTAKGYPDLATRIFIRRLHDHAPHVPVYALVDLDPDGIAIMSTYKYGSFRLAHENVAATSIPPNMRWLGLKRQHITRASIEHHVAHTDALPGLQGLMKLTARDRTKAMRMLEWDLCSEAGPEQEWRHELQAMLMLNVKAEIQVLDELPGGLISLLCLELGRSELAATDGVEGITCADDALLF